MAQTSGLTVRHFARESIELQVEFVICEEHRAQIRFSTTSSAADQHVVRGCSTDISPGGMGLCLGQFLPRMCEGTLRVFRAPVHSKGAKTPGSTSAASGAGAGQGELLFEHRAKIRRVIMRDEAPSYDVGVEFVSPDSGLLQRITELARGAMMAAQAAAPHADGPSNRRGAPHA